MMRSRTLEHGREVERESCDPRVHSLADVLFAELARALYVEEPLSALTEDYDHAAAMQRAFTRRLRFTAAVIARRRRG